MTAYLDEYNPNSRRVNCRVQADAASLKYNNIQSCIAVAIYPSATRQLVGVHLTTATTQNVAEMKTARDELKQALGKVAHCKAYLVANYTTHHAHTTLKRELLKIVSDVFICDVTPVVGRDGANIDVKIELQNNQPKCSIRKKAELRVPLVRKPVPAGGWAPGQPTTKRDKGGHDWVTVVFARG